MSLRRWEEGQVVSAVGVQCTEEGQGHPQPDGGHMGAHEQRPQEDRHHVGQSVLQRVGVDGCDGDGTLPLMVHLVEVFVQHSVVEQSVRVVEANLFHEDAHDELKDNPVEGRELPGLIPAAQPQQVERSHAEGDAHEDLIEVHPQDALNQLPGLHRLIGARLYLVALENGRVACHVHKGVQETHCPVNSIRHDGGAIDQQGEGVVSIGVEDLVPLVLPEVT